MSTSPKNQDTSPESPVQAPTPPHPYGCSNHLRDYTERCDSSSDRFCFDITQVPIFSNNYSGAPLPVLLHYGARPVHRLKIRSFSWEIEKMREDLRGALIRGDTNYEPGGMHRQDLVFGTRQGTFVHYDEGTLNVYSSSPRRAILAGNRLKRYLTKVEKPLPCFYLLRKGDEGLTTHKVEIKDFEPLDPDALELHYGAGFAEWSDLLEEKLKAKKSGVVIMEGEPGTGKSTYIKRLVARLSDSHRIYFIQPHYAGMISEPSFVNFWIDQTRQYPDKKFVIILEDAEKCLMRREDDNRSEVSSLLQLTDGLMGSFVSLTLFCTINCQASQLDLALLRPGRLIARKVFGRLSREEAGKVADKLGKPLPDGESISLAELYNDSVEEPEIQPGKILGFAA